MSCQLVGRGSSKPKAGVPMAVIWSRGWLFSPVSPDFSPRRLAAQAAFGRSSANSVTWRRPTDTSGWVCEKPGKILATLSFIIDTNFESVVQTMNMKCSSVEHYRGGHHLSSGFCGKFPQVTLGWWENLASCDLTLDKPYSEAVRQPKS